MKKMAKTTKALGKGGPIGHAPMMTTQMMKNHMTSPAGKRVVIPSNTIKVGG